MTEPQSPNEPEDSVDDVPELEDDGLAHSQIYMGNRLMLLCHRHALALIDLADGNGVKLRIEPLEMDQWGKQCRACMAAEDPGDQPRIILT
jgi:hypothetical protein